MHAGDVVRKAFMTHVSSYSSGHRLLRIIADAYECRALEMLVAKKVKSILYLSPKPTTLYQHHLALQTLGEDAPQIYGWRKKLYEYD